MNLIRLTLSVAAVGLTARYLSRLARSAADSVEPNEPLFDGSAGTSNSSLARQSAPDWRGADPAGDRTGTLADGVDEVNPGTPNLSREH